MSNPTENKSPIHDTGEPSSQAEISSSKPDYSRTLPVPTEEYITLYVCIPRLKVWRIVRIPLNYTFALLHTLLQFLFGWSGSHLHQFTVYDQVTTREGEIKHAGSFLNMGVFQEAVPDEPERKEGRWDEEGTGIKEEQTITLGDVWNIDEEQNRSFITGGQSSNEEIAIEYEYDFGASWKVHITCHTDDVFVTKNAPSNLPCIVKAKGAPPIEDVGYPEPEEKSPNRKRLPQLFYSTDVFAKYVNRQVHCVTVEDSMDIFTEEQAEAWHEAQQQKQETRERKYYGEDDEEESGPEIELSDSEDDA